MKCRGTVNSINDYTEAVVQSCSTEAYLESSRTSTGLFAKIVNGFWYFRRKAPLQIFDCVVNTLKFYKKGLLKKLAKCTRKNLCQSPFFDKITRCRSATLLKTWFQHKCFIVNFAKLVRTNFSQNTSGRLVLVISVSIVVKGDWQAKL